LIHGDLPLPAFLPDATLGAVRSLDGTDLESVGIQAVVMNVFHLMQRPGSSTIAALGGLHKMAGWNRPIVTDSGGFQAYSLIRQNAKFGRLTDQGIRFKPEGADREFQLTPEKSVQLQLAYGADMVICLDDCTHTDAPESEQRISVERTVLWARRCRREFDKIVSQRKGDGRKPLLFGVVQGGGSEALRRECADRLLEIGFDGFGFGGWPLDAAGKLLAETLCFVRSCIPRELPMHALGIGQPESVVACFRMGYELFDCALPTRDARNGRLYMWRTDPGDRSLSLDGSFRDTIYIDDDKHIKRDAPISPYCDCLTCRRYSIGYLRHLHKSGEILYFRLATLHNLRFMTLLMERLGSEE
jgi:queuine tRNA-ribosyltransferase